MKIGTREVGPGHPTFILAEAGTNHMGSVDRAIEYVQAAHAAGCDGVKFQCFVPDEPLFCPMEGDDKRRGRWNQSFMTVRDWLIVRQEAHNLSLEFGLSVFQHAVMEIIDEFKLDYIKVASRANMTFPYEKCEGPFIVSITPETPIGVRKISSNHIALVCISKYPSPLEESFWLGNFNGISDHSGTPWPAIDACFKGAAMAEVHFAINPDHAGPDKPVCLTPSQLELICEARDAAAGMLQD